MIGELYEGAVRVVLVSVAIWGANSYQRVSEVER